MIDDLQEAGLSIAVASNRDDASARIHASGLSYDLALTRQSVGAKKGSPTWVSEALNEFGISQNQIVWLGDSDLDMRSASHARIAYFNAGWSNASYPYGINVRDPRLFSLVVRECFMKERYWYWKLDEKDANGASVEVMAMLDGNGAGILALKQGLLRFLKYGSDPMNGPLTVRELIMYHLIGSIYGDGLHTEADTWTTYPGSQGGPNSAMEPFVHMGARLFRDRYVEDLLIRHNPALDSGQRRDQGRDVQFTNQANTIHLNSGHSSRIEEKSVVVVDDFATAGFSIECARNLLLEAGAKDVRAVNIGKYGPSYNVVNRTGGQNWDPYVPLVHSESDFRQDIHYGDTDADALTVLRDSYNRVASVTLE